MSGEIILQPKGVQLKRELVDCDDL